MNNKIESTSSSNSTKFTPLTIAALMPNLRRLQLSSESPDSSIASVDEDDNSFPEPVKTVVSPLRESNKDLPASNQPLPELSSTNKYQIKNDCNKENDYTFLANYFTYPNKDSQTQLSDKKNEKSYPSSEVKKRSLLLPYNQVQSAKKQGPKNHLVGNKQAYEVPPKKTPENVKKITSSGQKQRIVTPKIKTGIRKFTPGSTQKSQKRTPLKVTTNLNKESIRCLFPDRQSTAEVPRQPVSQQQEPLHPVPETPINRKPLSGGYVATPSYPQGVVGNHSKICFKTTNIRGKNYMYVKKLGSGGSSEVYKVLESGTSCEFAVKCVDLAIDSELAKGYINEVQLLRELQGSDRVIRLYSYEFDKSNKILRMVLEVGETDLSSFLRARDAGLPPALILHYWEEMLLAVKHIHEHGVIHADLKPANFLLVSGRLKLIDFGIASAVASDATSIVRAHATGTYSYISPEALTGGAGAGGYGSQQQNANAPIKISFRSDVWSLGCILYSMIYGRTPFSHFRNLAKLAVIIDPNHHIEYPPADHLPSALISALKWCLTYNMRSRPTVRQLLAIPYLQPPQPALPPLPAPLLDKLRLLVTDDDFRLLKRARLLPENSETK